jgi:uridine kinase
LEAYNSYPKKIGKSEGIKRLVRDVKNKGDVDLLNKAIANYSAHVAGKEEQYIKQFSTFASSWRDWLVIEPRKNSADAWYEQKLKEMEQNGTG